MLRCVVASAVVASAAAFAAPSAFVGMGLNTQVITVAARLFGAPDRRKTCLKLCLKFDQNESNGATESAGDCGWTQKLYQHSCGGGSSFVQVLDLFFLCTRQHIRSIYSIIGESVQADVCVSPHSLF